jgi:uncharacterized protein with FMN-binding domain
MRKIAVMLAICCLCLLVYAQGVGVIDANWMLLADGTYEGEHSFVSVSVTVTDSKISEIAIIRHGGGGQKYADMLKPLVERIIQKQSTDVDAVSGATVSSQNLKKAVEQALEGALTE